MSLKELKQDYLEFLESTPRYLNKAKELLNKDCLNYTYYEIEEFVKFYADNYKKSDSTSYKELIKILYTYLGTAFVNYQGGNWELNTTKTDKAYGTPTIVNWGGEDYPWSRISPKIWKTIIERDGSLGDIRALKRMFS